MASTCFDHHIRLLWTVQPFDVTHPAKITIENHQELFDDSTVLYIVSIQEKQSLPLISTYHLAKNALIIPHCSRQYFVCPDKAQALEYNTLFRCQCRP